MRLVTQVVRVRIPLLLFFYLLEMNPNERTIMSEEQNAATIVKNHPVLNQIVKSPFDARDYQFVATFAPQANTDLRAYNRDIEDQSNQGSCVPHGVGNAIEIMTQRAGKWEDLSNQFPYYVGRDLSNLLDQDGMYSVRDCLESSRRYGFCLKNEWVYSYANRNVRPPEEAYASALTRVIKRYEAIDISKSMASGTDFPLGINNIKSALAEGLPVIIAMALGMKFYDISGPLATQKYSHVHFPWLRPNPGNEYIGAHCMVIVGNDDALGGFIVENQWGTSWGDNGYCLIPYSVIMDFSEAWVIRSYKDIDLTDPVLYATQMKLVRLYVSCLGRAPELAGFKFWLKALKNNEVTHDVIAQFFLESDECRGKFGNNGKVVLDIIEKLPEFNNKVEVAAYVVLDLACDKPAICAKVLDGVTADPASVDIAKKHARVLMTNGVL